MSRIEIVPDMMGAFEVYGREYQVSPATDCIIRFVEHEYDYLRYLDPEAHAVTLHWLGQSALATVAGWGIPETRQRKKIQECEYEEYLLWKSNMGMYEFEHDIEELPDNDVDVYYEGDHGND